MWIIVGMQFLLTGVCYMIDSQLSKTMKDKSFGVRWWRTIVSLTLLIIDMGLLGFVKGVTGG